MAITFADRAHAADVAGRPGKPFVDHAERLSDSLKPVDQIAKRDRKVKKLETEIKEIAANPLGKRGRPSSGKVSVHMKLNPETVAAFRAHGPGWQALVSDILDAAAPKG